MRFRDTYSRLVLGRPIWTVVLVCLTVCALGSFARHFSLDASADSLTLERDDDLQYYRQLREQYGSDDYLIVAVDAGRDIFDEATISTLANLVDELAVLAGVESVISLLDVPLLSSPPVELRQIEAGIRKLRNPETDPPLARRELTSSPLYKNLVVSEDGRTSAIQINLREDHEYLALRRERDRLRRLQFSQDLTRQQEKSLQSVSRQFAELAERRRDDEANTIVAVRAVLDRYRGSLDLYMGGVPMIVADSIEFIRQDLLVFGLAVLVFLVVILTAAFEKIRWVMLPLVTCLATCVAMAGFLGLVRWPVTVVSSNFLSLLLILCLALTLHIIVRYRELHWLNPQWSQLALVQETVSRVVTPCFFTALTTMVAFGSLLVSGIRPVIDFGWMMTVGIGLAFVLSFTLFPAALMLTPSGSPSARQDITARITGFFSSLVQQHHRQVLIGFGLLTVASLVGTTRLTVENRFIDYYRSSTEIYRGMELIDTQLGGTTPLDVIVDAPSESKTMPDDGDLAAQPELEADDPFAGFEELDDDLEGGAGIAVESYWFNSARLPEVAAIHEYLDALPETGKVLSLSTVARVLAQLDPEVLQDDLYLSIVYERTPQAVVEQLIDPYLSQDGKQLRFSVRVFESDPSLRRSDLLDRIRLDLNKQFGIEPELVQLSGMLVLYNNMLQSLFRSQILTLGAVFLAIMAMFLLLFRSCRIAVAAIIPNLVSAALVLGLMGWLNIPLDLMTITIAAITIGIGVDDTIHYVHRFRDEYPKDQDYWASVARCHQSIGRAMYYTSVTIMLGFSILVLSQFVPTIYFGVLTGTAMIAALLANLTLLPILLVVFKAGNKQQRPLHLS